METVNCSRIRSRSRTRWWRGRGRRLSVRIGDRFEPIENDCGAPLVAGNEARDGLEELVIGQQCSSFCCEEAPHFIIGPTHFVTQFGATVHYRDEILEIVTGPYVILSSGPDERSYPFHLLDSSNTHGVGHLLTGQAVSCWLGRGAQLLSREANRGQRSDDGGMAARQPRHLCRGKRHLRRTSFWQHRRDCRTHTSPVRHTDFAQGCSTC